MELELNNQNGTITTYTGLTFSFINPTKEMIDIEDIARGLAYKAHFGGQIPRFFSIAEHSLLTYLLYLESNEDLADPIKHKLKKIVCLLHDGSEAYTGDMLKPLKVLLPNFMEIENRITKAIFDKFGLYLELLKEIKKFDILAQQIEFEDFQSRANKCNYFEPEMALSIYRNTLLNVITDFENVLGSPTVRKNCYNNENVYFCANSSKDISCKGCVKY